MCQWTIETFPGKTSVVLKRHGTEKIWFEGNKAEKEFKNSTFFRGRAWSRDIIQNTASAFLVKNAGANLYETLGLELKRNTNSIVK